jgi:hypothetical protein
MMHINKDVMLVSEITGKLINPGETITSFRGEPHVFKYISRAPEAGKTGKIIVSLPNSTQELEFYPSVFNCHIRNRKEVVDNV